MELSFYQKIYRFIAKLIHNENRIYKVNLKSSEYLWLFNCTVVIIAVCVEIIEFKWHKIDVSPVMPYTRTILAVYLLIMVFKIFKYLFGFLYTELKALNEVNKRLAKFIKLNKLFDSVKTKNGFERITYCPIIKYQLKHDKLIVRFRLDGSPRSNSYCNMQNQLQGIIKLKCTKVDQGVSWCKYEFRRGNVKQLQINDVISNTENRYKNQFIQINDNLKWNFRKAPHALISGITGAGKTYFLAYIIRMFLSFGADIKLIDPKRSDMSFLEKFLGENVAYRNGDIVRILDDVVDKMERRFDEFKQRKDYGFGKDYYDYGYMPTVIIFDELMSYMGGLADPEEKKSVMKALLEVIAKGRQGGFFAILTTQRPDTRFIDGSIRDQLSLRVALGKMSVDGYKMVFGSGQNLKLTEKAKGAGFIFIDGLTETPEEFNAPYLDSSYDFVKDIENLTANLNEDQDNKQLADVIDVKNKEELDKDDLEFDLSDI